MAGGVARSQKRVLPADAPIKPLRNAADVVEGPRGTESNRKINVF